MTARTTSRIPRLPTAWSLALVLLVGSCGGDRRPQRATVTVATGDVRQVALATGHLEPLAETQITAETGGVLTAVHVRLGDNVRAGQLLAEVRPVITDRSLLLAEREVESAQEAERAAEEFGGREHLAGWLLGALQGENNLARMERAARRQREAAEQRLQLLREGQVQLDELRIDFGVRAPVAGQVIELPLREGAPVVPASIYGTGTVLMTLADLDRPVFRGTIDETDVARIAIGTPVVVRVGALPGLELAGTVHEIGLRGEPRGEAVVFPVEITITPPADAPVLRAGYSAVAELVLASATAVPLLAERCVDYRDDGAFVLVADGDGSREQQVETGVSDGMVVEIRAGLQAGDIVLERDWSQR